MISQSCIAHSLLWCWACSKGGSRIASGCRKLRHKVIRAFRCALRPIGRADANSMKSLQPRSAKSDSVISSQHDQLALLEWKASARGHRHGAVEVAVIDPAARQIVWRHFEADTIAGNDADAPLAHLAAGVRQHLRAVRK